MSDALYAAAFIAEFERRKEAGITPNFQVGYPYRGESGHEAWEQWCADLAHEYAQYVVQLSVKAANRRWAKRNVG